VTSPTNIFTPASTPAEAIAGVSVLVLEVTGAIFVVVCGLLVFTLLRYRRRSDDAREPAQVYGSAQVEIAWTVVPMLIVVVLFVATGRVITRVQNAGPPDGAVRVVAIGHQFWWEYRYPDLGVVTANELHVPVGDRTDPAPTFITLLSADTDHSFWIPRLAGKTDLIPNRINSTWIEPTETGVFLGQCAQYCGTQHAKMLLRVYADTRATFDRWVASIAPRS
jgi:cytochrome c oxidase subunit 2